MVVYLIDQIKFAYSTRQASLQGIETTNNVTQCGADTINSKDESQW